MATLSYFVWPKEGLFENLRKHLCFRRMTKIYHRWARVGIRKQTEERILGEKHHFILGCILRKRPFEILIQYCSCRSWNNPKQISPKLNRHEMKWSRSVRGGSMNLACLSPSKYCQFHQHQCLLRQRTRHRRTQCRRQCLLHRTKRSRWSWQFQGTHRKTSSFSPRQQSTWEWRQLGHPKN